MKKRKRKIERKRKGYEDNRRKLQKSLKQVKNAGSYPYFRCYDFFFNLHEIFKIRSRKLSMFL